MTSITPALQTVPTQNTKPLPSPKSGVTNLALDILKASILGISLSATAYPFVRAANVPLLKIMTISAISAAILLKQVIPFTTTIFNRIQKSPHFSENLKKIQAYGHKFINYYPHLALSVLDFTTRLPLIHEKGHALVGKLLFKNANPFIEIVPLGDSYTKLTSFELTPRGEKLGAEKSYMIFAAAGPVFGTFFNLIDLTIAHAIQKSCPDLNKFLTTSVIINTARHAVYALSVLFNSYEGHDFYPIWKTGKVHPIAASALIVATPVIYQLFLSRMFPQKKEDDKNPILA